jgi:hypothetical protein
VWRRVDGEAERRRSLSLPDVRVRENEIGWAGEHQWVVAVL